MFLLAGTILINLAVNLDLGGPDIRYSQKPWRDLCGGLARLLVVVSTALSKTSYGLTLLRMVDAQKAESPRRKLRWLIWFILASINLTTWPAAVFSLLGCNFGFSTEPGQCWVSRVEVFIGVAGSGWSGAADVVLALMPLDAIWHQKAPGLVKVLIIFSMTMGLFAAVAAFVQCSQIANSNMTSSARESHPALTSHG